MAPSKQYVGGIRTSAEYIRGGVTTYTPGYGATTHGRRRADEQNPPSPSDHGYCEHCHYVWDPSANSGDGGWVCSVCGCELEDGCDCADDPDGPGYCWCPIGDGWQVWLFMIALAGAYVAWKTRGKKINEA